MADPFIGEIRMFGGTFAPANWAFCNGQLMPIAENEALFQLLGTTYGGDGQETFGLPNLQGRVPVHQGRNPFTGTDYQLGEMGGSESVTLSLNQIPNHSHQPLAAAAATQPAAAAGVWGGGGATGFVTTGPTAAMAANSVGVTGGSQPHDNMVPFLAINFIIALFGIFPTQN